jgi:putative hydrolase of the HAD superfamily
VPLRAILFDLDDTLLDRAAAFARWVDAFVSRYPAVDRTRLAELDGRGHVARRVFFSRTCQAFGLRADPAYLEACFRRDLPNCFGPATETAEFLARLSPRFRLGVVTNGAGATQRAKVTAAGLDRLGLALFIGGEVGADKPHPLIFARALGWAGCAPGEALFVGDDPECDIAGPARAGMRTAWLAPAERTFPTTLPPPDLRLGRLGELLAALG